MYIQGCHDNSMSFKGDSIAQPKIKVKIDYDGNQGCTGDMKMNRNPQKSSHMMIVR